MYVAGQFEIPYATAVSSTQATVLMCELHSPDASKTNEQRKKNGENDMSEDILGIHHITAIAGEPQRNLDFYAGVLGLRLVKQTVNFDDPTTYHLY